MIYSVYQIRLDSTLNLTLEFTFDFLDVVSSETDADLSRVYASIDGSDFVSLAELLPFETLLDKHIIRLRWTPDQSNRRVTFIMGGDYKSYVRHKQAVILSNYYQLAHATRYGREGSLFWAHCNEVTAPSANSVICQYTIPAGRRGYIYGFFITASEPNSFRLRWTSNNQTLSIVIPFSGAGAIHYADLIPLNEGAPADPNTPIQVLALNSGSSGSVYQARILVMEV